MAKCDWGAGQYLQQLLREDKLKEMVGETALVPMLVEEDELIAFWGSGVEDVVQYSAAVLMERSMIRGNAPI